MKYLDFSFKKKKNKKKRKGETVYVNNVTSVFGKIIVLKSPSKHFTILF
jgi:hypothetical protein